MKLVQEDIIGPFVEGTLQMMGTMLGVDGRVVEGTRPLQLAPNLFGSVTLAGTARGRMTVGLEQAEGRALVGAMLGLEGAEVDEALMCDGLGEIANMIAGFAVIALSGSDMDLEIGLPEVGAECPPARSKVVRRTIESELGAFHLSLELSPGDARVDAVPGGKRGVVK